MPSVLWESQLKEITKLRKTLHSHPELSGHEQHTAGRIKAFLKLSEPDRIIERLGGHGIAAIYDSGNPGPAVLLRADLDALPIDEVNDFAHRSKSQGVSHKCGHDGHMAIVAGVSTILKNRRPSKGRVVLLFQPEEETGQGAAKVIADPKFDAIRPDYAFALHNLPGYDKNAIVFKEGPFASASTGMIIRMHGRSSHAAHPEQGNSPVNMMTQTIRELMSMAEDKNDFKSFVLLTIIHARLGEVAFGTTPGKAVVMATLRTYLDEDMIVLKSKAENMVRHLEEEYDIECIISYVEEFPATINHPEVTHLVEEAVRKAGADRHVLREPFRWSEDFGHFTTAYPGAMFGIGAGMDHPSLHNHDYDFPDEIIETGIKIFYQLTDKLVKLTQ